MKAIRTPTKEPGDNTKQIFWLKVQSYIYLIQTRIFEIPFGSQCSP